MLLAITIIKTTSNAIALAAAIVTLISAERQRQYELVRELGTLENCIENQKIILQSQIR
jgi:hypothetical protein